MTLYKETITAHIYCFGPLRSSKESTLKHFFRPILFFRLYDVSTTDIYSYKSLFGPGVIENTFSPCSQRIAFRIISVDFSPCSQRKPTGFTVHFYFLTISNHGAKLPLGKPFIHHHHEVTIANTEQQQQQQQQQQHPPYNLESQHPTGVVV
jgi:hypothetical protein